MTTEAPLYLLFDSRILITEGLIAVLLILLFTLLILPSVLRPGAKTEDVARAAYSYIAQTIGLFLMTVAGLPAFMAAIGWTGYSSGAYAGLLTVFAVGGLLFLWQDGALRKIDVHARQLPQLIFMHVWKLIGLLAILVAGLSSAFYIFTNTAPLAPGWWVMYLGLFLYGILVSWLTFDRPHKKIHEHSTVHHFTTKSMKAAHAAKVKKPVAKRKKK